MCAVPTVATDTRQRRRARRSGWRHILTTRFSGNYAASRTSSSSIRTTTNSRVHTHEAIHLQIHSPSRCLILPDAAATATLPSIILAHPFTVVGFRMVLILWNYFEEMDRQYLYPILKVK
jgi:hypothetical protein